MDELPTTLKGALKLIVELRGKLAQLEEDNVRLRANEGRLLMSVLAGPDESRARARRDAVGNLANLASRWPHGKPVPGSVYSAVSLLIFHFGGKSAQLEAKVLAALKPGKTRRKSTERLVNMMEAILDGRRVDSRRGTRRAAAAQPAKQP